MELTPRPRSRRVSALLAPEIGRRWARWLFVVAVAGSALALGGAHVRVVLFVAFALALAGVLSASARSMESIPAPALCMAGLAGYSLLQSIPLPLGALQVLSPEAADVWSRALRPFGDTVITGSLSLDPGASTLEAAKWLAYAVVFTLSSAIARRYGASWGPAVVFGTALLVALATLGHGLVGATRVFGVYEPSFGPSRWSTGPILNPNCLAGYLNLGILCGLGFTFSNRQTLPRWLWALGVAVLLGVSLLAGSRGGAASLVLALLVFGVALFRLPVGRARLKRLGRADWAGLAAAVLVGLAFTALGARELSVDQLLQKDVEKVKLSSWIVPLLGDFPVFGVGRGAFEGVFPAYRTGENNLIYSHPENLVAQWLSEWGLVVGLVAFAAFAWLLRPQRLGVTRRITALAAYVGVVALVVQNLVDLSLELMGPAIAASLLLGSCWGGAESSRAREPSASSPLRPYRALVLPALLAVVTVLALVRGSRPVAHERLELRERYATLAANDRAATAELWSDLKRAMQQHPAEPYFPRLGALLSLRTGEGDPMAWIQRALERSLTNGRTHLILARVLKLRGVLHQALLEARLAVEYDPDLADEVGAMVGRWTLSPAEIERAAPLSSAGAKTLYVAARTLDEPVHARTREALYRLASARDRSFLPAERALALELLDALDTERCGGPARVQCEGEIQKLAQRLDVAKPESLDGVHLLARFYAATGRPLEAERALRERCPRFADRERVRCLSALLSAMPPESTDPELLVQVSREFVKQACSVDPMCEKSLVQAGDAVARAKQWMDALHFYERAVQLDANPALLMKVANAAKAVGRFSVAERALSSAAARAKGNERLHQQIQRQRDALFRAALQ